MGHHWSGNVLEWGLGILVGLVGGSVLIVGLAWGTSELDVHAVYKVIREGCGVILEVVIEHR